MWGETLSKGAGGGGPPTSFHSVENPVQPALKPSSPQGHTKPAYPLSHPVPEPHLDITLGFVQAVQRQLQVGAPAGHHAGAGHVAELCYCFQEGRERRHRGSVRVREEASLRARLGCERLLVTTSL